MWTAVALFIACIGKSGQFPLHTWLPDAMAGPTPVSSLLHSSTMVVAGVFLVARLYPVFHVGLDINMAGQEFNLIAVIGGITVLVAAVLAFVQNDIKRVLAYSTVSQLGYMMMGLGVGAWTAAVFHIFTHAFFKCCLFLCAGSVSHTASHHSFDMKKDMGGIWRKMPVTFITWMMSTAALVRDPVLRRVLLEGRDHRLGQAQPLQPLLLRRHHRRLHDRRLHDPGHVPHVLRQAARRRRPLHGRPRRSPVARQPRRRHGRFDHRRRRARRPVDDEIVHATHTAHDAHDDHHAPAHHSKPLPFAPDDSPWQITGPLVILGVLAVISGYLNAPAVNLHWFEHWTESSIGLPIGEDSISAVPPPPEFSWAAAAPGLILVALGIILSWTICQAIFSGAKNPFRRLVGLTERNRIARAGHTFLVQKLYLDHLYEQVIVHAIAHPIAKAAYWFNQHVIDGIVNGVGRAGRKSALWVYRNIDQRVVDGAVNASGLVASEGGHALQPVQSGKVNQYGALLFGGAMVGAIVLILLNV